MNEIDIQVFDTLFREACRKCFGHPVDAPLTETESKLMYTRIFDDTGLVIGWKSIKNYSVFLLSPDRPKPENPSVPTFDTLARYVAGAPYTTEPERRKTAGHYPYWYEYKAKWVAQQGSSPAPPLTDKQTRRGPLIWAVTGGVLFVFLFVGYMLFRTGTAAGFADHFQQVSLDSLNARKWWVNSPDTEYWNRRGETLGCLTLFTLRGDNWPDSLNRPAIRNLLIHRIDCDSWTLEVHLKDFIPTHNWQQAGILLMEDTGYKGASMRVSIAFNDYNGIYPRAGTILVQGIASRGNREDKPEEFAHVVLLQTDSARSRPALYQTLAHAALRIEKRDDHFRILYADGIAEGTAFKEISSKIFSFRPRYVGLFALQGYVDTAAAIPAHFTYVGLEP